jgi:type VI secretion system secreted protein Hcp
MKRSSSRGFLIAFMLVAGLFTASNAMAAVDMFLKMTLIKGESKDAVHKDEMDVLAWSWGESSGTARTGKGVLPAACIQDLSLTKYIDSASPQLIMNGVTGVVTPEAVLTMRKATGDGGQIEFLILKMSNVIVSSYSTGGSGGEDRLTENVALHFEAMRGEYRRQKPDGTADAPVIFEVTGGTCK